MGEHHAEHLVVRVAGFEERAEHRHVRLGAGVRLHVGVVGAEQLLRAIDRELLGHVDELASAVVAAPRVALGVLVVHRRADRGEDGRARVVLRRDQAQRACARARARSRSRRATSGSVAFSASQSAAYSLHHQQLPSFDRRDLLDPRRVAPAVERRRRATRGRSPSRRRAATIRPPMLEHVGVVVRVATAAPGTGRGTAPRGPRRTLFAAICSPWPEPPSTMPRSASPSTTARAAAAQNAG